MQLLASEEYGLRCLLRVAARDQGPPVSIAAIAEAEGLSPEYTAKLMRQLRIAGVVTSTRGADGGYRLARPRGEITVWAALEALGGAFYGERFCACHAGQRERCVRGGDCSIRALWRAIQTTLRDTLEGITLADLQRDEKSMVLWLEGAGVPIEQAVATNTTHS